MIELTDEILNKYIDGELTASELTEVENIINFSEDAKRRLYAMQLVHNELKNYTEKTPASDFTSKLMKKIIRKPEAKGQKYFIFSVSSFFVLISLAIIAYITSFILSSGSNVPAESNGLSNMVYLLEKSIYVIKKIFTAGNISVIGFIFSFAIIISAYFFFDSHRQTKEKLNKL